MVSNNHTRQIKTLQNHRNQHTFWSYKLQKVMMKDYKVLIVMPSDISGKMILEYIVS